MRTSSALETRGLSKVSLLVSAAAAVMLSACSTSLERFSSNVSDKDPVYTASAPKAKAAEPADDVEVAQAPADDDVIASKPLVKRPLYANNQYNYQPKVKKPAYRKPIVEEPQVAAAEPEMKWVPANDAGQKQRPVHNGRVTVGQGMTLYSIAKANGLSVGDLAAANNIDAPYSVRLGQSLKIPGVKDAKPPMIVQAEEVSEETPVKAPNQLRYKKAAETDEIETPAPAKKKAATAAKGSHTVGTGETLFSLGRKYGVSPFAIADANNIAHDASLKLGQKVAIPGKGGAVMADAAPEANETVKKADGKKAKKLQDSIAMEGDGAAAEETPVAEAPPKSKKLDAAEAETETAQAPAADPSLPGFRWPVRGKVISPYGAKPGGLRNEGVNIAVPEGTSVRAAESGIVAYAGNELKGYGNLVLVRHEGGWVTAYAHAKELFVKRGDTVKRGDVIAKAGQTGSVSSPQLHFEVRKGATAMDPLRFLNKATAAN